MAEITIRLHADIETGKKDIIIELAPDATLLPYEHEEKHKELVEKLLGEGVLKPEEVGGIRIERVQEEAPAPTTKEEETPERLQEEAKG